MNELDLGKVVGSRIYQVSGQPEAELGLVNDWALDTESGEVWERTEAGWQAQGSFKGEKGDTGAIGPQGETGPQGPKGDAGADGADGKTPALSINSEGHLIATYE